MADPRKIRPLDGWCVVLADQRKTELASGIVLPGFEVGAEKVMEGSGEVVRVGIGDKNAPLRLRIGDRIVFRSYLKYANPIENDETWPDGSKKTFCVISTKDILGEIAKGVEVGVFSGRPQVPAKERT